MSKNRLASGQRLHLARARVRRELKRLNRKLQTTQRGDATKVALLLSDAARRVAQLPPLTRWQRFVRALKFWRRS